MIMAQDRAQFCNWGHIPNKPQKQLENHNIQHVAVANCGFKLWGLNYHQDNGTHISS